MGRLLESGSGGGSSSYLSSKVKSAEDVNSKTTNTGTGWSGNTWTGAGEDPDRAYVRSSIHCNVASTVFFDFGYDGIVWNSTFPVNGFEAATFHEYHGADLGYRYFRIRVVFDSLPTEVQIHTTYSNDKPSLNLPLGAAISSDTDASIVRSVDTQVDMALGRVGGFIPGAKFGRNPDIDIGSVEDVWNGGGDYTGQPVGFTPETVTLTSSSALDASAMTGARTVRITGLKTSTSTVYESEDITPAGLTNAVSVGTWWRVNRVVVLTAGSGGNNAGTITVKATTTTAVVFAVMPAGMGQTMIAAYTVPQGYSLLVKRIRAGIVRSNGSAGSATMSMRIREAGGVYRAARVFELQTGAQVNYTEFAGSIYPAGSDIKFRVDDVSDSNTVAEAAIEYILIAD